MAAEESIAVASELQESSFVRLNRWTSLPVRLESHVHRRALDFKYCNYCGYVY